MPISLSHPIWAILLPICLLLPWPAQNLQLKRFHGQISPAVHFPGGQPIVWYVKVSCEGGCKKENQIYTNPTKNALEKAGQFAFNLVLDEKKLISERIKLKVEVTSHLAVDGRERSFTWTLRDPDLLQPVHLQFGHFSWHERNLPYSPHLLVHFLEPFPDIPVANIMEQGHQKVHKFAKYMAIVTASGKNLVHRELDEAEWRGQKPFPLFLSIREMKPKGLFEKLTNCLDCLNPVSKAGPFVGLHNFIQTNASPAMEFHVFQEPICGLCKGARHAKEPLLKMPNCNDYFHEKCVSDSLNRATAHHPQLEEGSSHGHGSPAGSSSPNHQVQFKCPFCGAEIGKKLVTKSKRSYYEPDFGKAVKMEGKVLFEAQLEMPIIQNGLEPKFTYHFNPNMEAKDKKVEKKWMEENHWNWNYWQPAVHVPVSSPPPGGNSGSNGRKRVGEEPKARSKPTEPVASGSRGLTEEKHKQGHLDGTNRSVPSHSSPPKKSHHHPQPSGGPPESSLNVVDLLVKLRAIKDLPDVEKVRANRQNILERLIESAMGRSLDHLLSFLLQIKEADEPKGEEKLNLEVNIVDGWLKQVQIQDEQQREDMNRLCAEYRDSGLDPKLVKYLTEGIGQKKTVAQAMNVATTHGSGKGKATLEEIDPIPKEGKGHNGGEKHGPGPEGIKQRGTGGGGGEAEEGGKAGEGGKAAEVGGRGGDEAKGSKDGTFNEEDEAEIRRNEGVPDLEDEAELEGYGKHGPSQGRGREKAANEGKATNKGGKATNGGGKANEGKAKNGGAGRELVKKEHWQELEEAEIHNRAEAETSIDQWLAYGMQPKEMIKRINDLPDSTLVYHQKEALKGRAMDGWVQGWIKKLPDVLRYEQLLQLLSEVDNLEGMDEWRKTQMSEAIKGRCPEWQLNYAQPPGEIGSFFDGISSFIGMEDY